MIVFPNAKINLGLQILGKRKDGYHDISTCFYPVPWKDILEITPAASDKTRLTVTGLEIPPGKEGNLCLKAYNLMKKDFDLPEVNIHLHKIIPIGGGLGGGSSDGAFTLKLLSEQFNLLLEDDLLSWYALKLASDCPFFINNKPVIASGRGEIMENTDLDLSSKFILLVNPGFPVSTAEAYRTLIIRDHTHSITDILSSPDPENWGGILTNDFEEYCFRQYPELKIIKDRLYESGALYASLTGSGSCMYGIFNNLPQQLSWFREKYMTWSGPLE